MTKLFNDPARFTEDMLVGFLDANARYVAGVPGGVVRAHKTRPGKVAVVIGGGSGHYPAFCGTVGPGFADGAVVGNIFTSPSAEEAASVARAAARRRRRAAHHRQLRRRRDELRPGRHPTAQRGHRGALLRRHRRRRERTGGRGSETARHRRRLHRVQVRKRRGRRGARPGTASCGSPKRPTPRPARSAWHSTAARCPVPTHPLFTVPAGPDGTRASASTVSRASPNEPMPTAADLAATLVDGVLGDHPEADVAANRGDSQRAWPHQVRRAVRRVG